MQNSIKLLTSGQKILIIVYRNKENDMQKEKVKKTKQKSANR